MSQKNIVIGLDIGTIKIAWAVLDIAENKILNKGTKSHGSDPKEIKKIFDDLKNELEGNEFIIQEIIATGSMASVLNAKIPEKNFLKKYENIKIIPERAAQEEAVKFLYPNLLSLNLLRLGGNGFSILTFQANKFAHHSNDKCSSGSGSAIERLCHGRFGISIEQACELALSAKNPQKIAARCAVFVKSEITHLANQGWTKEDILASYFNSLAVNIWGLANKKKVPGKFILIGGVVKNKPIVNRLKNFINGDVEIPEYSEIFEALGAAHVALKLALARNGTSGKSNPQRLAPNVSQSIGSLPPLNSFFNNIKKIKNSDVNIDNYKTSKVVLGLDLGSTGSKIAILEAQNKTVIYHDYLPTQGNPVGATKALLQKIPSCITKNIISIGITGSGRYTAASIFQAAYPDLYNKVIVKTEIIAHAKSACYIDPDKGKNLSVIEIGGQDAKYTLVTNGEIEDSIMNLACAAGTGSFLEEQNILYNINDIKEFGRKAYNASKPADLGQHCTVFVAELANKAMREGYDLDDIFAGFYYSVVYNYVNRVMGKRIWGEKIFLQGKPASNIALACAFVSVLGKEVIIPPNTGEMGAIGIALCAIEEGGDPNLRFDLKKILSAKILSRGELKCNSPVCKNFCRINLTVVEVDGEQKSVFSGGMCPKYELSKKIKLPSEAPNPFKEREELMQKALEIAEEPYHKNYEINKQKKTIGIPAGLGNIRYLPFFAAFFKNLGLDIKITRTNHETLEKGDGLCSSYDTCAPIKIAHGLFEPADYFFFPKIKSLPLIKDEYGSCTCPLVQGAPNLVELAVKSKFLKPILDFSGGIHSGKIENALIKTAQDIGYNENAAKIAFKIAVEKQIEFEKDLLEIGKGTMLFAKKHDFPVILICGRLYTIYDKFLNSGIPQAVQESGAVALPIDCYPTDGKNPLLNLMYWGEGQRNLRGVIDIIQQTRNGFGIYPIWVTNYICGPDSFLEHFFRHLCEGYPHITLETDGHSGAAGFVTRIEAFLHSCRSHMKSGEKQNKIANINYFRADYKGTSLADSNVKLIIPPMGDGNKYITAVCRSYGIETVDLPQIDKETFLLGRKDCSGKECIPFMCVWGAIKKWLMSSPLSKKIPLTAGGLMELDSDRATHYQAVKMDDMNRQKLVFLVPTTTGPCRFCMYNIRIKQLFDEFLNAEKIDAEIELFSPSTKNSYANGLGGAFQLKFWAAAISSDLLHDMLFHTRPTAKNAEEAELIYLKYREKIIQLLEKKSLWKMIDVLDLLEKAAMDFSKIINKDIAKNLVDVAMVGEIYAREENFGNDDLIRKLEKYGLRVKLSPYREWINYVAFCENRKLKNNFSVERFQNNIKRAVMGLLEKKMRKICAKILDWSEDHSIEDIVNSGLPYLGNDPEGEAILSIGAPMLMFGKKEIKGTVLVGPYGCMPTKLAEAQLNRTDIPLLAIFTDGEPIDESKIANFAWQLRGIDSLIL